VSIYDAPWQSYPAGGPDTLPGGSNHVTGVNQVAYTADFGQGITLSGALQDPTVYDTTNIWNLSFPGGSSPTIVAGVVNFFGGYGAPSIGAGMVAPDIIGALRIDQAWGLFQFSAVAHDNHASFYGSNETFGHPSDKWGWAAQVSLSIKNIPTGPGDSINLQAAYTDGATRYNFQSLFPTGIAMFGGTSFPGAYQSIGFAAIADAVFTGGNATFPNSGLELVKSWGFRGGYTHNWSPTWATGIYGAYGAVDYGGLATAAICFNARTALALTGNCNPDFNIAVVGANVVWTPVKNLAFSADVNWTRLDQKYDGTVVVTPPATFAKPTATYELRDQNSVTALLRAQRNF
jgi:Porin subfamily